MASNNTETRRETASDAVRAPHFAQDALNGHPRVVD